MYLVFIHHFYLMTNLDEPKSHWLDDSLGRNACCQTWFPKCGPQDQNHGRREPSCCFLTFICMLLHVCPQIINTQIDQFFIKKNYVAFWECGLRHTPVLLVSLSSLTLDDQGRHEQGWGDLSSKWLLSFLPHICHTQGSTPGRNLLQNFPSIGEFWTLHISIFFARACPASWQGQS